MANKPKLNQPDAKITTTLNDVNITIPSSMTKDFIIQQSIVDFKQHHVELNHKVYGDIKIEPDVITYNGRVYAAIKQQTIPTFDDCVKEWLAKGWGVINKEGFICFRTKLDGQEKDVIISKDDQELYFSSKEFTYDGTLEYFSFCCSFEIYDLLTKTINTLKKV